MKLKKSEVEHVAALARLKLSAEEVEMYRKKLGSILSYVQTLNELDTTGVKETAQISGLIDIFRDDKALDWDKAELEIALEQGEREDGAFKVKRVL